MSIGSVLRNLLCALLAIAFGWAGVARAEDSHGPPASPSIASSLPANGDPFGTRASLAALGVTYGINYIGEGFDVVNGGRLRGTTFDGRAEFYSDANLEK